MSAGWKRFVSDEKTPINQWIFLHGEIYYTNHSSMSEISNQIAGFGIIPVIVLENANDAPHLGKALQDGGLPCAEVTFRTGAAAESIQRLAQEFPDFLVGAGTVLTIEQAEKAINSGARFIISPGFNPRLADYCRERGVALFPGICTPTEIEAALEKGLTILKVFPAEQIGGLDYIKAIAAPYSMVRYIPTGGITLENLRKYLAFNKVLACGGTWMVKSDWIAAQRFDLIRDRVWQSVQVVREVRGAAR